MKIFRLIGILFIGSTLFSCSNNEDELLSKEQEENEQETYTISFDLGGEFISTSETPLSRTEVISKKIYGINVYYKKDDNSSYQNYAYGLFDNIEDMTISLIGGYKYKFECSMVKNDVDTLYNKHIAKKQIWAKRSELADTAFVTLCFSMEQSQRNATSKPNGAEVQLPPHYSHNGCRFLAK